MVARTWARVPRCGCARSICGIDFTVEGEEHIPDEVGVILMKHSSTYETIAQFELFPWQCLVLKREFDLVTVLRLGAGRLAPDCDRPARRTTRRWSRSSRQGKQRLAEGLWVMIFPEGTRMAPGETRRYGVSGALLAREAGCLIVPVAHNAGDFWPRRSFRIWPGTVRFCIGPPINPAGREPREINTEVQTWIETKVAEIRQTDA